MNNNIIIKIENLNKVYDTGAIQVHALKNVNLTIRQGEYVAIMGQSGSGKSTLMNILGCLDKPTSGTYELDGIDISKQSQNDLSYIRNKKIGFVFQSFNLIPRTSALKNVELPMIYARVGATERRKRAIELLTKVGLGDRIHHMPNEISGGQKQRIAIARALTNDPAILLADEPTGNLDTASSIEIMNFFTQLNNEGVTVIVVTHEDDIAAFTNRVLRFRDGEMIEDHLKTPASAPAPTAPAPEPVTAPASEPAPEPLTAPAPEPQVSELAAAPASEPLTASEAQSVPAPAVPESPAAAGSERPVIE